MSDHYDAAAEVRIFRRKFSLAIADLSEILDMTARAINRWESGQAVPNPSALEALRALDRRMQHRLIERIAQLKQAGATTVPFYRDRSELTAHESFYLHLPSALYEWEIAQLVDRLGVTPIYTQTWRDEHELRADYLPATAAVDVTPTGGFSLAVDPRIPRELAQVLTSVQPAFGAVDVTNAIAFASHVPLNELTAVCAGLPTVTLAQPWAGGPSVAQVTDHRHDPSATVDVYIIDDGDALTLEIAALDCATAAMTWTELPSERLPWLAA